MGIITLLLYGLTLLSIVSSIYISRTQINNIQIRIEDIDITKDGKRIVIASNINQVYVFDLIGT